MDSLITAAARALAAGDPLTALNQVALRDDAAALAMREFNAQKIAPSKAKPVEVVSPARKPADKSAVPT